MSDMQISADCRWLLSSSLDGTVRCWDIPGARLLPGVLHMDSAPAQSRLLLLLLRCIALHRCAALHRREGARMVVSFVRMRTPPKFTQLEDKHNITTHNLSSLASPSPLSYTLDSAFHACSPCLCPHPVASPRLPALAAEKPKAGTKRAADGKAKKEESSEEEDSDDDEDEEEVRRAGA